MPSLHSHSRKRPDQGRLLADALDQDVAGALQRGLGVGDALVGGDELGALRFRHQRRVLQQRVGQRLEARLARDLRLGAALGLEGCVQVFQLDLGVGAVDRSRQLRRQLALLLDALENGGAPVLQLAQVAQPLFQLPELRVVEAAGLLLAVAGNERHRRAFTQQLNGGGHLGNADTKLRRDALVDLVHAWPFALPILSLSSPRYIVDSRPRWKPAGHADRGSRTCCSLNCHSRLAAALSWAAGLGVFGSLSKK